MFGDCWERCGDVVEGEGFVGTITVGGCEFLELFCGPGGGVGD